jgi:hypothetical protein
MRERESHMAYQGLFVVLQLAVLQVQLQYLLEIPAVVTVSPYLQDVAHPSSIRNLIIQVQS